MSENPMQFVVAAFQQEEAADAAWAELKAAKITGLIGIDNMAIIRRDAKDKIHIKEQGDPGGGKGAVIGGVLGGALGMIAGPLGAVLVGGATGALVGGLTGKAYDSGIPDDQLNEIASALQPGTSAIVALIEHKWVAELEKELAETEAKIMTQEISAEIASQLSQGNDMAFTAVGDSSGVVAAEITGNEESTSGAVIAATGEGVVAATFETVDGDAEATEGTVVEAEVTESDETSADDSQTA
jgi:uncharacterized membrane protein